MIARMSCILSEPCDIIEPNSIMICSFCFVTIKQKVAMDYCERVDGPSEFDDEWYERSVVVWLRWEGLMWLYKPSA